MKKYLLIGFLILLIIGGYFYSRPVPAVLPVNQIPIVPRTEPGVLKWPEFGQAALGADDYGLLAAQGSNKPVPIGSITKIITALAVLKQKPLSPGEQGPTITLNSADVELFNYYYLNNGSVTKVAAGQQITQLHALQALLIPSSNNMADSLAKWAFGSMEAYLKYANDMVKQMGLANTTVGDTNGFSDTTISTAADVVKLGIAAIDNPIIAQIVRQPTAQIPVSGIINNTNFMLGKNGVVGIKTGNTEKAGGCYLFASERSLSGKKITLVGAFLNAPSLVDAINATGPLADSADTNFQQVTVLKKGQVMGTYDSPWGESVKYSVSKDISLFAWKGAEIKVINNASSIPPPADTGTNVGTVTVESGSQRSAAHLKLENELPSPSWHWRLLH